VPRVFLGQIERIPGVELSDAADIEIRSAQPVLYHIDGEPFVGGASVKARVRPRALRVICPAPGAPR
jgi:diacylglycerol kinase family enzyme